VAFKHAGQPKEEAGEVDSELRQFKGMKTRVERLPVRLRVTVDGEVVLEQSFAPRGVHDDSASVGTVELPMTAGTHRIRIELGDTADPEVWSYEWNSVEEFEDSHRRVVQFDAEHGFVWD
ncbi:MAG: hypothetical protein KDB82_16630, partial [Planctomycetes bacterium]|nr:hypothetical protein [Planctomycetota bacterium]